MLIGGIPPKSDVKEIDIVLYDDEVSRYSFEDYYIYCTLTFKHPKGLVIPFNSDKVTITATEISLNKRQVVPCDFSNMDSWTYKKLNEHLSKKGLSIE